MAGTKASKYYEDLINQITTAIDYGDTQRAVSAAAGALGEMALGVEDMRLDVEEQKKFLQEAYQEAYNQFLDPYVKDRSLSLAMYMQGMNNIAALMGQYASQRTNIANLLSAIPEPVKRVSPVTYGIRREAAQAIDEQLNRSNEYEQRMYATKLSQLVEQEKLKLQQRQLEQGAVFRYVDMLKDIQDKKVELEKDLASIRKEGFTSYLTALTALPDRQDKAISNITGIISSLANIAQNAGSNAIQLGRLQLDKSQLDVERELKDAQAKYYESLSTFNQERANQLRNQVLQTPANDLDEYGLMVDQVNKSLENTFEEMTKKPFYVFEGDSNDYIKDTYTNQKLAVRKIPEGWGDMKPPEKLKNLKEIYDSVKRGEAVPAFIIKVPGVNNETIKMSLEELMNNEKAADIIANAQLTEVPPPQLRAALSANKDMGILGIVDLNRQLLKDKIREFDEKKNILSPDEYRKYLRLPEHLNDLDKAIKSFKDRVNQYVGTAGQELLEFPDEAVYENNERLKKVEELIKGFKNKNKNDAEDIEYVFKGPRGFF
jgi:hypothetical protein